MNAATTRDPALEVNPARYAKVASESCTPILNPNPKSTNAALNLCDVVSSTSLFSDASKVGGGVEETRLKLK